MEQDCLIEVSLLHLICCLGLEHVFVFCILPLDFLLFDRGEARESVPDIRKAIMFL